jgi:hypothetical protein
MHAAELSSRASVKRSLMGGGSGSRVSIGS